MGRPGQLGPDLLADQIDPRPAEQVEQGVLELLGRAGRQVGQKPGAAPPGDQPPPRALPVRSPPQEPQNLTIAALGGLAILDLGPVQGG